MKIPTTLLDATRSRFWRTKATPPARIAAPVADDADVPASSTSNATDDEAEPPPIDSHAPAPPRLAPGDMLLASVDACSDGVAALALLAAASVEAREQMRAALSYREMSTLRGRNPQLGALVAALDSCADASARATLLAATSPALLVQLAEHLRHDKCEVIAQRYMDSLVL